MLKLEHVTKYYDDFRAVNDLSFEIHEGEIFGLLGVNGAGKTTTFRMIMGLLEPDKGTITLDGKKIDYKETDKIGFVTVIHHFHAPAPHAEDQQLFIGAKTVFEDAQQAEHLAAVAFKRDDGIHHMLQQAGTSQDTVLGHMAHQHQRDAQTAAGFGVAQALELTQELDAVAPLVALAAVPCPAFALGRPEAEAVLPATGWAGTSPFAKVFLRFNVPKP